VSEYVRYVRAYVRVCVCVVCALFVHFVILLPFLLIKNLMNMYVNISYDCRCIL